MTTMINPRLEEIASMPAALPEERSTVLSSEGDNGESNGTIQYFLTSNAYCDLEDI